MRTVSRSGARAQVEAELERILASVQFRTSQRSQKFLQYVVEHALSGEFDALKERVLGVELYRRDPLFDTEQDSIVRVAAKDVRKRLSDYYQARPDSAVQIAIPTGVYVPKIDFVRAAVGYSVQRTGAAAPAGSRRRLIGFALMSVVILLVLGAGATWRFRAHGSRPDVASPVPAPLWSTMLRPRRPVMIVVADANLVIAKVRSGHDIPIGTYASREFRYAPDLKGHFGNYLNGIPLTTVSDAMLAARISAVCARAGADASVRYCSRLESSDLKGPDPMVLLGSSTSNPWVGLFNDGLNFRMVHDFDTGFEICVNRDPRPGELARYTPRPDPQGVSEGYALVALTRNLGGAAPILIIAGTNTQGTEAAGDFVTNTEEFGRALRKQGIGTRTDARHLELLIRTKFLSASSVTAEIVAWRQH